MDSPSTHETTRLIEAYQAGDQGAREQLFSLLADELSGRASRWLRDQPQSFTLRTNDLVQETLLRLLGPDALANVAGSRHLSNLAALVMEQVLCDHVRKRKSVKHGGAMHREPLDDVLARWETNGLSVLEVREALQRLEKHKPVLAEIVRLRIYLELTTEEIAGRLGLAPKTIESKWRLARIRLHKDLGPGGSP